MRQNEYLWSKGLSYALSLFRISTEKPNTCIRALAPTSGALATFLLSSGKQYMYMSPVLCKGGLMHGEGGGNQPRSAWAVHAG